ncbi:MAG: ATP:cob(I)alamin adenosyltransferase [Bacteroidetes bacterium GWF2_38_335]|nr:MAG: ATP:cob(I)alamin adenosyltransferase [Bacteroidetes bacterium GWF2_38_335]OFY81067.1 MAG: ATP:cob(I)alamin adenosyltransferase [Bacteroidetes bacterium RIFOXYA12_FULL_38_20]HBS87616.1 cob(I)yrinic acid a,c-diamide adenosyltransferase [Bacteroidales bacterium]
MTEKKWNIYTRTGDKGTTSLVGGKRVKKNHIRIEAYGTVDELISWIGYLRDHNLQQQVIESLVVIQDKLMVCASLLATENETENIKNPVLTESDIEYLEGEIDEMEKSLTPLTNFILPGGSPASSVSHICRTVCRRAERRVIDLADLEDTDEIIIRYLNRLSDFLFVLSRRLNKDFRANEITWKPKL